MKTFRDSLLEHLAQPGGPTLRAVAAGSGVSYEQLKKVKQGGSASTNVDDAVKVAGFFGLTLDQFLSSEPGLSPHRVTEIYSQLSSEARARLEGYAEALRAEAGRSSPSDS